MTIEHIDPFNWMRRGLLPRDWPKYQIYADRVYRILEPNLAECFRYVTKCPGGTTHFDTFGSDGGTCEWCMAAKSVLLVDTGWGFYSLCFGCVGHERHLFETEHHPMKPGDIPTPDDLI